MKNVEIYLNGKKLKESEYTVDEKYFRLNFWTYFKIRVKRLFGIKTTISYFRKIPSE